MSSKSKGPVARMSLVCSRNRKKARWVWPREYHGERYPEGGEIGAGPLGH